MISILENKLFPILLHRQIYDKDRKETIYAVKQVLVPAAGPGIYQFLHPDLDPEEPWYCFVSCPKGEDETPILVCVFRDSVADEDFEGDWTKQDSFEYLLEDWLIVGSFIDAYRWGVK